MGARMIPALLDQAVYASAALWAATALIVVRPELRTAKKAATCLFLSIPFGIMVANAILSFGFKKPVAMLAAALGGLCAEFIVRDPIGSLQKLFRK